MLKGFTAFTAVSLAALIAASPAFAEAPAAQPAEAAQPAAEPAETPDNTPFGNISATITGVTDYRDRGMSQSDEKPALQGSIDWTHDSGFYLGTWLSNVDFNDGDQAEVEWDVYGGYGWEWGGFEFDLMANWIMYPGASDALDYDLVEFTQSVSRAFGIVNAKALVIYSPDNSGDSGTGLYPRAELEVPILETGLNATGTYGFQYVDDAARYGVHSYADWSLGLAYSWEGFDFALQYIDTNLSRSECAEGCGATAVFTVARTFGGKE